MVLRSCLGQSLGPGALWMEEVQEEGWESRSHDSWSEGRRVWWPCPLGASGLREVGRGQATRILV